MSNHCAWRPQGPSNENQEYISTMGQFLLYYLPVCIQYIMFLCKEGKANHLDISDFVDPDADIASLNYN